MNPIKQALSILLIKPVVLLVGAMAVWALPTFALNGQSGIHDPSTLIRCNGRDYTFETWRVMPKFASTANESLVLSAVGSSFATLAQFDPASDKQRWLFKAP